MYNKFYISNKFPFNDNNKTINIHEFIGKHKKIDINNKTFAFDNDYYQLNNHTQQLLNNNNIILSEWK
jgi:hypothetical protein